MIVQVSVVIITVMMMTSAQVVETSVNAITNSPSQDDHNLPTYDMTPVFKPFTEFLSVRIQ